MQRYFALSVNSNQIFLEEGDVFHVTKVMRGKIGDNIIALFEKKAYKGEIVSLSPLLIRNIGELQEKSKELEVETTLFFALAKGDKIDFVIQKATELGVSKIILIKTEHCIVKMDNEDLKKKISNRYFNIAKEASEQSERYIIPEILGVYDIDKIPTSLLAEVNLLAYEKENYKPIDFDFIKGKKSVSILIGPEGGLTTKEVDQLIKSGFKLVSLGKRILRTETAAITGLSMINMVIEHENTL